MTVDAPSRKEPGLEEVWICRRTWPSAVWHVDSLFPNDLGEGICDLTIQLADLSMKTPPLICAAVHQGDVLFHDVAKVLQASELRVVVHAFQIVRLTVRFSRGALVARSYNKMIAAPSAASGS